MTSEAADWHREQRKVLTPLMLNHAAWVTHDVEATAKFYTGIMGMELANTVIDDTIPSTGDPFPYFHIFFRMQDGSTIAFFEAPGLPDRSPPTHPAYELFDHIALQAADREEVDLWRDWLVENKIDVIGPTNHGIIYSVYFHDPNGIRLEITTPLQDDWNTRTRASAEDLELWCAAKRRAEDLGLDVSEEMIKLIHEHRKQKSQRVPE